LAVVSVLLVEEQTVLREFMKEFVERLPGYSVVGEARTQAEAEALCTQHAPVLAIVDCVLPDASRVNVTSTLRRCSPETKILVFSAAIEPDFVQDAIGAGVAGFIDKWVDLETLRRAIQNVVQGRQFFSSRVSGVLRELLQRRITHNSGSLLTHREREVLREIAKGRFSKEIAASHALSVFTVENIRRRIMRKTGLRSVAELTLHALKLGLVPAPLAGREGELRKTPC
jgi:DNA-binding NarL/FixJ family response regulator